MKIKYWQGTVPSVCDLCKEPITNSFIDGKHYTGPWAIMCDECYSDEGCRLGLGLGQRYVKDQAGQWAKVAG